MKISSNEAKVTLGTMRRGGATAKLGWHSKAIAKHGAVQQINGEAEFCGDMRSNSKAQQGNAKQRLNIAKQDRARAEHREAE